VVTAISLPFSACVDQLALFFLPPLPNRVPEPAENPIAAEPDAPPTEALAT